MLWIIRLTSTKKQKLPSAYFSHGKSPFLKGKPSINGPFSMKFTGLTAPLLPRSGAPKPHQRQGLHHPGAVACWQLYKNIRYNVQVCIYIYCFLFILIIYTYIYIYINYYYCIHTYGMLLIQPLLFFSDVGIVCVSFIRPVLRVSNHKWLVKPSPTQRRLCPSSLPKLLWFTRRKNGLW